MATITTIEDKNGTVTIEIFSRHGHSVFAGGTELRMKAEKLQSEATHVLINENIGGINYWVTEPVRPVHKTSPLYTNIHITEAIQKLLSWYVDDERIIHIIK